MSRGTDRASSLGVIHTRRLFSFVNYSGNCHFVRYAKSRCRRRVYHTIVVIIIETKSFRSPKQFFKRQLALHRTVEIIALRTHEAKDIGLALPLSVFVVLYSVSVIAPFSTLATRIVQYTQAGYSKQKLHSRLNRAVVTPPL